MILAVLVWLEPQRLFIEFPMIPVICHKRSNRTPKILAAKPIYEQNPPQKTKPTVA